MTLLKTAFSSAALLAGGLFAMTPETADAQIRVQIGDGYGYGNGYRSGQSGYRYNNYGVRGSRYDGISSGRRYSGYRGNNVWHDTSHYDYHPTTIRRHRDHYHVQPGHYDIHRSGHYDRVDGHHGHHGH